MVRTNEQTHVSNRKALDFSTDEVSVVQKAVEIEKQRNIPLNQGRKDTMNPNKSDNVPRHKTPVITTILNEPKVQTKSIEDIIRETENSVSPFVAAGPVREIDQASAASFDRDFSLTNKFQQLRLQTDSLSNKSSPRIVDHKEDIPTMMVNLKKSLEDKMDENIRLISEKWDFGINMLNDEFNLNFDDIKNDVLTTREDLLRHNTTAACGECQCEKIIEAQGLACKQMIEIHSTHLSEMMCRLGEKLDHQAHQVVLLHMNVTRIVSMLNNKAKKETDLKEEIIGNNPFAEYITVRKDEQHDDIQ
ncbi:uncharacterized protein MELLADRAFT_64815 [Melampsora larici-populina 98AG31]|uniref:Uncharacterized protein n=1 Tax=Melampsora larici-populina (strain 98AG31 / pathotype 3-4-7) TaxID=747676 RepID=F4RSX0_MELLP|nr:uncharacterized protein MELLADRAFT_64815 [Melampsora larici-populina 98AG31]EGG04402.1 hypothetical protein MELLADRAFT_64815 [Melampsora larici-populina 98AG31]